MLRFAKQRKQPPKKRILLQKTNINEYMDKLIGSSSQLARDAKSITSEALKSSTRFKFSVSEVNKPNKLKL